MRPNFIIIPLFTIITASLGIWLTNAGLDWYGTLTLPAITPPGEIIGWVWTGIYILSTLSALILWNRYNALLRRSAIMLLFFLNAVLNVTWSWLFFNQHLLGAALGCAALIAFSVLAIMAAGWPLSRTAAILLLPYLLWVVFASHLNYIIWTIN